MAGLGRETASRILVAAATLGLLVAVAGAWIERTVLDSRTFAARAVTILDNATIRTELAETLADQLTEVEPQLIRYRPLVTTVLEGVLVSEPMRTATRSALQQTHQIAVTGSASDQVVDLAAALGLAQASLSFAAPDVATLLPSNTDALVVQIEDEGRALGVADVAHELRWITYVAGLVAIAGYLAAFALSRDRRRTTLYAGAGGVIAGLLVIAGAHVARGYVTASIDDPFAARAAGEVVDRFTGDLRALGYWVVAYATLVIALAAVPRSLARRADPLLVAGAWLRRAARTPATIAGRTGRALALLLAGFALLRWPSTVLALLGTLAAAALLFTGIVELIAVVGREPARAGAAVHAGASPGAARRRTVTIGVVGTLALVLITSLATFSVRSSASAARADAERLCNGHAELCERRLDEVTFAGTHNAMSAAAQPGWFFPAHRYGIADQLAFGIRAFLIDVYYGVPSPAVHAPGTQQPLVLSDRGTTLAKGLRFGEDREQPFDEAARTAQAEQLAAAAGRPADATPQLFLCHAWCELGATPLADVLRTFGEFMAANPDEVVILIVEDYVTGTDFAAALEDAGLGGETRTLVPGEPVPSVGELIDDGSNLVVAAEQGGPPPSWFHSYGTVVQDTPFHATTVDEFSCDLARGSREAPLLLVNHWLSTGANTAETGRIANARDVLLAHAERCRAEREHQPNIVAVDWYDEGDLLGVVDTLNGLDEE
jgi:hypothetical protein